jgi:hypothetical protein
MPGAPQASEAVTAPACPPALGPFFSHRCLGSRERRFSTGSNLTDVSVEPQLQSRACRLAA